MDGPSNHLFETGSQPIPGVSNGGVGSSIESRSQEVVGTRKSPETRGAWRSVVEKRTLAEKNGWNQALEDQGGNLSSQVPWGVG